MSRLLRTFKRNIGGHATSGSAAREVSVRVRGGYDPDIIFARVGVPLRLVFCREESSPCSEQVVFPAFGKSLTLPEGEQVAVDLLPTDPGTYEFTCAMGMLRGWVVVPLDERTGPRHARHRAARVAVQAQPSVGGGRP